MIKEELIKLLKEYKQNKAKLNIKLKELKSARIKLKVCDDIETNITNTYGQNQNIRGKNKITNKVLSKIEKNDTVRLEIETEIEELENIVKALREKVEIVEDRLDGLKYKERKILIAYYVDGRTAEDIGTNLYFQIFNQTRSSRQIQGIIKETVDKLIKL